MTCVYCGTKDNPDWCYCRIVPARCESITQSIPLYDPKLTERVTTTGQDILRKILKNGEYGKMTVVLDHDWDDYLDRVLTEAAFDHHEDALTEHYFEEDMRDLEPYDEPITDHVTVLFPDGERQIKCDDMGRPCRVPGYKFEQTITGEWYAI